MRRGWYSRRGGIHCVRRGVLTKRRYTLRAEGVVLTKREYTSRVEGVYTLDIIGERSEPPLSVELSEFSLYLSILVNATALGSLIRPRAVTRL